MLISSGSSKSECKEVQLNSAHNLSEECTEKNSGRAEEENHRAVRPCEHPKQTKSKKNQLWDLHLNKKLKELKISPD